MQICNRCTIKKRPDGPFSCSTRARTCCRRFETQKTYLNQDDNYSKELKSHTNDKILLGICKQSGSSTVNS